MEAFPQPRHRNEFEIAIICALQVEADAVEALFDEFWNDEDYGKAVGDINAYTLGRIGRHNVVLAHMHGIGKANAANVASCFRSSFPGIHIGLVVGICGAVPKSTDNETEIVLGDVIISTGLVQYDFGRKFDHGFSRKDTLQSNLGRPSAEIRALLAKLGGRRSRLRLQENTLTYLAFLSQEIVFPNARYLGADQDSLFESTYRHKHHGLPTCYVCAKCVRKEDEVCSSAMELPCIELRCNKDKQVTRSRLVRSANSPAGLEESHTLAQQYVVAMKPYIHFGLMASGDTVMKSGEDRDRIAAEEQVIAFEMEGAGIWDAFPCVVIKGVCDYADSHKNKKWQGYAASTAAACMKAFLKEWISSNKSLQIPAPPILINNERNKPNDAAVISRQLPFSKETMLACLRTLSYSSIDDRKHNIALAYQNTCNWIFETSAFQQWWNQDSLFHHNGVLWIKGKPGAGKSTLMKHILLHCHGNFKGIILAYFFNARGNKLEKTLMGMLRSLLYQLLERDAILCRNFIEKYLDKVNKHGRVWEWTVGELQNFLLVETRKGQIKPSLILIDALDECDDLEVQRVVEFVEELSISAVIAKTRLHICLSSRYYPTIDMKSRLEFKMEDQVQHNNDIIQYVRNKLRIRDRMIEEELLKRAKHVFLWVVLVVEMLNHAFDRGKTKSMKKKLQEIPSDLDGVFLTILQKDSQDQEATVLMFQWVLFAAQPLKPEELYFAVIAGTEPEELGAWDHERESKDDIKRYIINISKGLIEIRKGDEETVQFIHESVNDFLLRNKRLQTLHATLQQDPIGVSHDRLVACCMSYIKMKDLDSFAEKGKLPDMSSYTIGYLNHTPEFLEHFPFTAYAATYVLPHAEMAQAACISQQACMQWLQHGNFKRLMIFHNAFVDSYKAYTEELIYATSLDGLYELAKIILQDNSIFINKIGGLFGSALQAASTSGNIELVTLLLEKGADVNLTGGQFGSALQGVSYFGSTESVMLLLEKGADVSLQGGVYGSALQAASTSGNIESVTLLLEKGADVNLIGGKYGSALQGASFSGSTDSVMLLLEKGADVNLQGGVYGSALQAASTSGNIESVTLLLEKGADVNLIGGKYGSALQGASYSGSTESVMLLLEKGADVNLTGGPFGSALQAASTSGNIELVTLLLEKGADVNLTGGPFESALQAASYYGHIDSVALLIEKGANVNLQAGFYGPSLQCALAAGYDSNGDILNLLLKNGSDVNLQGGYYGTALQAASQAGKEDVVALLIRNGADVNLRGGKYGSALHAALEIGHQEVVTLLRAYGATG